MRVVELTNTNHQEVLELFDDEAIHYYFLIDDLRRNNYQGEGGV